MFNLGDIWIAEQPISGLISVIPSKNTVSTLLITKLILYFTLWDNLYGLADNQSASLTKCKPHFTTILVMTSHESNACLCACRKHVFALCNRVGPYPAAHAISWTQRKKHCFHITSLLKCLWSEVSNSFCIWDRLKALLSHYITTKVLHYKSIAFTLHHYQSVSEVRFRTAFVFGIDWKGCE